jgi:hypothetical protein
MLTPQTMLTRTIRTSLVLLLVAAVVGVVVPASTVEAQQTLSTERRASPVGIHDGTVMWSRADAEGKRFRLVSWRDGQERTLGVRSRSVPFDVDLGPGPAGRTTAVYSRCQREPARSFGGLPEYTSGRRCGLYSLDVLSGRERRLRGSSATSRVLPAIWRGRVAFAERRLSRGKAVTRVRSSTLSGRAVRTVGRGSAGRTAGPDAAGVPLRIDLRGSRATFDWRFGVRDCPGEDPSSRDPVGDFAFEIWAGNGTRTKRIDRACDSGEVISVRQPSLSARGLAFVRTSVETAAPSLHVLRTVPFEGRSRDIALTRGPTASAVDGSTAIVSVDVAQSARREYQIQLHPLP